MAGPNQSLLAVRCRTRSVTATEPSQLGASLIPLLMGVVRSGMAKEWPRKAIGAVAALLATGLLATGLLAVALLVAALPVASLLVAALCGLVGSVMDVLDQRSFPR